MAVEHDMGIAQEIEQAPISRKRRGLIAGAAALMVAALAKQGAEPVAAVNGQPVILGGDAGGSGAPQGATNTTWIAGGTASAATFRGTNSFPATPDAAGDGVQGMTVGANQSGIFGRNNDLNGVGTWGAAPSGTGAFGDSTSGSGVAGNSSTASGVYGQSGSGTGVQGISGSGYGLYAQSTSSAAVYGLSTSSYGGVFITSATTAGQYGVLGGANGAGLAAFGGANPNAAGYAAYFTGNVRITSGRLILDSQTLQSLNAHSDGSMRAMYGTQSAEPSVEDMGEATLSDGTADVKLDPAFAGVIATDRYLVFLTSQDANCKGLAVVAQRADGFAVQELNGGTSSGAFAWRLVAKPKDAGKVQRLAKVDLPTLKVPATVADLPKPTPVTIPTPRPAKGPSVTPPKPQPQPQPRDAASPASQPASEPTSPPAPPPAPSPAAPAATGGTQPAPLPPSR